MQLQFSVARVNVVDKEVEMNVTGEQDEVMFINDVKVSADVNKHAPYVVEMRVQGSQLDMEVDTGASVSLVPKHVYDQYLRDMQLEPVRGIVLKGYSGSNIPVLGRVTPIVEHNGQREKLPLLVVDCASRPCLLGRDWLAKLRLDWLTIVGRMNQVDTPSDIKVEFNDLFGEELGDIVGMEASVELEEGVTPKFHRCREVPFSLHDKVMADLDRQVAEGVLVPVQHSSWASPLVVVLKGDGVRLCGFQSHYQSACENPILSTSHAREDLCKVDWGRVLLKTGPLSSLQAAQGVSRVTTVPDSDYPQRPHAVYPAHKGPPLLAQGPLRPLWMKKSYQRVP